MKIILSPAKTFTRIKQVKSNFDADASAKLLFPKEQKQLRAALEMLQINELNQIWNISPELAQKTYDQFFGNKQLPARPAILSYDGLVYKQLDVESLPDDALDYLQKHLRIISGYYGLLRPFDLIHFYRLEMKSALALSDQSQTISLLDFWADKLAKELVKELKQEDQLDTHPAHASIVNLASKEYAAAVLPQLPQSVSVVDIIFEKKVKDAKGQIKYKTLATKSKMARGRMLRFLATEHIQHIEQIQEFQELELHFDEKRSNERAYHFVEEAGTL